MLLYFAVLFCNAWLNLYRFICQLLSFGEEAEEEAIMTASGNGMRFVHDPKDKEVCKIRIPVDFSINVSSLQTSTALLPC